RSCTGPSEACEEVSISLRSIPEQKDLPAPESRIAPTPASRSPFPIAAASSRQSAPLRALRFSGRFRTTRRTRPSRLTCSIRPGPFPLIDIDLHPQQLGVQCLDLCIQLLRT